MLLRLDPELAERLQTVAEVEGRSVSDVAREAIAALSERVPVQRLGTVEGEALSIELSDGTASASLALTLAELSSANSDDFAAFFA